MRGRQHLALQAIRGFSTSPQQPLVSPYKLLEVHPQADKAEISRAFKQKALLLHPDLTTGTVSQPDEFIQLVEAYELLSDAEARAAYDAQIARAGEIVQPQSSSAAANSHRSVTQPAATGPSSLSRHVPEDQLAEWRYGVGSWMGQIQSQSSALDTLDAPGYGNEEDAAQVVRRLLRRYKHDLNLGLASALQHAYLGPRLSLSSRAPLPPCFEAEHRSEPYTDHDLLQLVSGRTVLGRVSLTRPAHLVLQPRAANSAHQLPGAQEPRALSRTLQQSVVSGYGAPQQVQQSVVPGYGVPQQVQATTGTAAAQSGHATHSHNSSTSSSASGQVDLHRHAHAARMHVQLTQQYRQQQAVASKGGGDGSSAQVGRDVGKDDQAWLQLHSQQLAAAIQGLLPPGLAYHARLPHPSTETDVLSRSAATLNTVFQRQHQPAGTSQFTAASNTLVEQPRQPTDTQASSSQQLHSSSVPGTLAVTAAPSQQLQRLQVYQRLQAKQDAGRFLTPGERLVMVELHAERAYDEWLSRKQQYHPPLADEQQSTDCRIDNIGSSLGQPRVVGSLGGSRAWKRAKGAAQGNVAQQQSHDTHDAPVSYPRLHPQLATSTNTTTADTNTATTVASASSSSIGIGSSPGSHHSTTHSSSAATIKTAITTTTTTTTIQPTSSCTGIIADSITTSTGTITTSTTSTSSSSRGDCNDSTTISTSVSSSNTSQTHHTVKGGPVVPHTSTGPTHWPFDAHTPGSTTLYLTLVSEPDTTTWAVREPAHVYCTCCCSRPPLNADQQSTLPAERLDGPPLYGSPVYSPHCSQHDPGSQSRSVLPHQYDPGTHEGPDMPNVCSKGPNNSTGKAALVCHKGLCVAGEGPCVGRKVVPQGRVKVFQAGRLIAGIQGEWVYNTSGVLVARVVKGGSLGVHLLHVFDYCSSTVRVLCRAQRAILLPSSMWLFPPRSRAHSQGGWSVEWVGFRAAAHATAGSGKGWLDPRVYVMVMAFATLDFERAWCGGQRKEPTTASQTQATLAQPSLAARLRLLWARVRLVCGMW